MTGLAVLAVAALAEAALAEAVLAVAVLAEAVLAEAGLLAMGDSEGARTAKWGRPLGRRFSRGGVSRFSFPIAS